VFLLRFANEWCSGRGAVIPITRPSDWITVIHPLCQCFLTCVSVGLTFTDNFCGTHCETL